MYSSNIPKPSWAWYTLEDNLPFEAVQRYVLQNLSSPEDANFAKRNWAGQRRQLQMKQHEQHNRCKAAVLACQRFNVETSNKHPSQ